MESGEAGHTDSGPMGRTRCAAAGGPAGSWVASSAENQPAGDLVSRGLEIDNGKCKKIHSGAADMAPCTKFSKQAASARAYAANFDVGSSDIASPGRTRPQHRASRIYMHGDKNNTYNNDDDGANGKCSSGEREPFGSRS